MVTSGSSSRFSSPRETVPRSFTTWTLRKRTSRHKVNRASRHIAVTQFVSRVKLGHLHTQMCVATRFSAETLA